MAGNSESVIQFLESLAMLFKLFEGKSDCEVTTRCPTHTTTFLMVVDGKRDPEMDINVKAIRTQKPVLDIDAQEVESGL